MKSRTYTLNHIGKVATECVRDLFSSNRSTRVTLDNYRVIGDVVHFKFNYRTPTNKSVKFILLSTEIHNVHFTRYCNNRGISCCDIGNVDSANYCANVIKWTEWHAGVHFEK